MQRNVYFLSIYIVCISFVYVLSIITYEMSVNQKEKSNRNRGKNFDSSEIQLLTELVEKNIAIINSKFSNTLTNEKKKAVWQSITDQLNALGVACRSVKEIKTKWTNMHQSAKREFSDAKISQRKTGGGPMAKPLSVVNEKIVDLFKDSPSFNGLSGFETQSYGDGNMELIGSPKTVSLLSDLLIHVPQHDNNEQVLEVDVNHVLVTKDSDASCTSQKTALELETEEPASTSQRPGTSERASACTTHRKKIKPEDVTRMQYEVLVKQKNKLEEQTLYYKLMNKKLKMELNLTNED
ncbi:uncharacterized protein LOC125653292 [Ostrea edulis]|uniref:uncharacterized protein LOC125653292 n=1 Tax=Ostrea edulis TaxID=37623 RepID=UPI0024AF3EB1|nr:uncharacterized protein LOC125653292 [Ostrea edulis]